MGILQMKRSTWVKRLGFRVFDHGDCKMWLDTFWPFLPCIRANTALKPLVLSIVINCFFV